MIKYLYRKCTITRIAWAIYGMKQGDYITIFVSNISFDLYNSQSTQFSQRKISQYVFRIFVEPRKSLRQLFELEWLLRSDSDWSDWTRTIPSTINEHFFYKWWWSNKITERRTISWCIFYTLFLEFVLYAELLHQASNIIVSLVGS